MNSWVGDRLTVFVRAFLKECLCFMHDADYRYAVSTVLRQKSIIVYPVTIFLVPTL